MESRVPTNVWILGAGFSRALGAPLFRDLFQSNHRVVSAYCGRTVPIPMIQTLRLYREHVGEDLGGAAASEGLLWRDPEDFLDVVESAAPGTGAAALLQLAIALAPEEIADWGRRALAMECSQFLRGANLDTERWLPYQTWAGTLSRKDTVVTFNYDRVPELLAPTSRMKVMVPDRELEGTFARAKAAGSCVVLKLHGSVDWVEANGDVTVDTSSDLPETCNKGSDLVMAIPGPGKDGMRKRPGMSLLWAHAGRAIRSAYRIVFIGYRFPPTDAQARVEILSAIGDAAADLLTEVKIVLGPNENDEHVVRMKRLLSYVVPPEMVEVIPLYAEDFLSLVDRRPLLPRR